MDAEPRLRIARAAVASTGAHTAAFAGTSGSLVTTAPPRPPPSACKKNEQTQAELEAAAEAPEAAPAEPA